MPVSGQDAMRFFQASGYRFLPVEAAHAVAVEELPPHHQDPFDLILVTQALVEPMHLLTHDRMVARYSDTIIHIGMDYSTLDARRAYHPAWRLLCSIRFSI